MNKNTLLSIMLIVCSFFTVSKNIFWGGFFIPHDFTHAGRIAEMSRTFLAGNIPVRWSQNFGFGYGMPLFSFYAPLPYYVAVIPYISTQDVVRTQQFLYVLALALGATGTFFCAKRAWGKEGALFSTILAICATYQALNVYVRGDIGELFAYGFLPFLFWTLLDESKNVYKKILLGGIFFACILLSHNLTGMMTGGFLLLFGLLRGLWRRKISDFISILCTFITGISLSAFYVIPAFFEKKFTRVDETITVGYFDYHNHFVALRQFIFGVWGYGGSVPGLQDGISFALGSVTIFVFIVSLFSFLFLYRKNLSSNQKFFGFFLFTLFSSSIFLASTKSVLIWENLPLLRYVQFPWRLLGFAHFAIALFAGILGKLVPKNFHLISTGLLVLGLFYVQGYIYAPKEVLTVQQARDFYQTSPEFIRSELSKTLNDYLPKEIIANQYPIPTETLFSLKKPNTITVTDNRVQTFRAQVHCVEQCDVEVHVFQFPGWTATIDGQRSILRENARLPIYTLTVPSGSHEISVQLEDTKIRMISNLVSVVTFGVILFSYARHTTKRQDSRYE